MSKPLMPTVDAAGRLREAVYGETGKPSTDVAGVALRDDLPLRPGDIYGYTKLAGEEM